MLEESRVLHDLISIPSINPALAGPSSTELTGEGQVNAYLLQYFRTLGLDVFRQPTGLKDRDNVGALLLRGKQRRTIVLQAHTDTVDVGERRTLLNPRIEGGRIYGRGACDDKGGLAALLVGLGRIARHPMSAENNIVVMGVADEEHTWKGSLALVEQEPSRSADFGIVGEPTSCKIVRGHKGVARFAITTSGRSCHSSDPDKGINAIYAMAKVVNAIEDYQRRMTRNDDTLLGGESISVGTIRGGVAVNVVPDECEIKVDQRLIRGRTPERAVSELMEYLQGCGIPPQQLRSSPLFDAQIAFALSDEEPGLQLMANVAEGISTDRSFYAVAYGSDAFRMNRGGIPTALWGPGSLDSAHSADEYCELEQLQTAAAFYEKLMGCDLRQYEGAQGGRGA